MDSSSLFEKFKFFNDLIELLKNLKFSTILFVIILIIPVQTTLYILTLIKVFGGTFLGKAFNFWLCFFGVSIIFLNCIFIFSLPLFLKIDKALIEIIKKIWKIIELIIYELKKPDVFFYILFSIFLLTLHWGWIYSTQTIYALNDFQKIISIKLIVDYPTVPSSKVSLDLIHETLPVLNLFLTILVLIQILFTILVLNKTQKLKIKRNLEILFILVIISFPIVLLFWLFLAIQPYY